MGLFMKKTKPDEELLQSGIRGHATVLHVEMPRMGMEMSMSASKMQQVLEGDVTPIRKKIRLRVEVPGREAYEVETKLNIPVMVSGKVAAGAGLTVLVDPDEPKHLAVDWSAGVEQGSTTEMLADNPMAQAALRGAGYDPAQLGQQMDAYRAYAAQQMAAMQTQGLVPPGVVPPVVPGGVPGMASGAAVPGQVPPGAVPPIQLPPGWQVPAGFPQVPGATPVPMTAQVPDAAPANPEAIAEQAGPISEDKPED